MLSIISNINVSWLDVVFFLVFLKMIYRGSRVGVGGQLLSFAGWFVIIFAAITYYSIFSSAIFGFLLQKWSRPVSFFAIAAGILVSIRFLEMVVNVSPAESLSSLERVGGLIIGSLRAFLLFGIIGMQLLILPISYVRDSVTKYSRTGMVFVMLDAGIYSWMTRYLGFVKQRSTGNVIEEMVSGEEAGEWEPKKRKKEEW